MNVIQSHHHKIFTEQVYKIAVSADDDKRIRAFSTFRQNLDTDSRALAGFDFQTKPRHRLTMQQGGETEDRQRSPKGDKGLWGTGAKGLKECL